MFNVKLGIRPKARGFFTPHSSLLTLHSSLFTFPVNASAIQA